MREDPKNHGAKVRAFCGFFIFFGVHNSYLPLKMGYFPNLKYSLIFQEF